MQTITYTIPSEMQYEFEQAFFDAEAVEKTETTVNNRQYFEYQQLLQKRNISHFNVLDELDSAAHELYNKGFHFDIEVKFINRGLRGDLTLTHVFKIDDDNPETYICRALKNAFEPVENFTDSSGTMIGFKKSDEFIQALEQLQITSKPNFNDVAFVDESKIYESDKQFLDDATIEEAIRAAKVDVTTAHLMRQQLLKVPNVAQHVYYIRHNFFLGWLRNQKPNIGVWIQSDWEDFCFVACKASDLEACFEEWWALDVTNRYMHYERNRRNY